MSSRTTPPRLLDTQLLIWMAFAPEQLPSMLIPELESRQQRFFVSVISFWEVAIKRSLNRPDFQFDAAALRQQLRREGFEELPIKAEQCHAGSVLLQALIATQQLDPLMLSLCDQQSIKRISVVPGQVLNR